MIELKRLQQKLKEMKLRKAQMLKNPSPPKKRGRPKKEKPSQHPWVRCLGVSFVKRSPGPSADSHRWVAVHDNQVIGYYKTHEAAEQAYNEITKTDKKENKRS